MTLDEFAALARRHGGVDGKTPVDGKVDDASDPSGKAANPDPIYRYVFKDGTYMTMRGGEVVDGKTQGGDVVDPGTAIPQAPGGKPGVVNTDPGDRYIVTLNADGTTSKTENPNYKEPGSVDATKPTTYAELVAAAKLQWEMKQGALQADLDAKRISIEQFKAQSAAALAGINAGLERDRIGLDRQRVGMEGQRTANDTARVGLQGQQQSQAFAANIVGATNDAWRNALPYYAADGTQDAINRQIAQIGSANPQAQALPTTKFPYDPNRIAMEQVAQVLAGIDPTAAAMVGKPQGQFGPVGPGGAQPAQPAPAAPAQPAAPPQPVPFTAPIGTRNVMQR